MKLRAPIERDLSIPEFCGDAGLRPFDEERIISEVQRHMLLAGAPALLSARLSSARWKPGLSIACVHELLFEDDVRIPLHSKRYLGTKGADVARSYEPGRRVLEQATRLTPFHAQARGEQLLWSFPAAPPPAG